MSDLNNLYAQMWKDSIDRFRNNTCVIDPLINSPTDKRRGVTVLSYIDNSVALEISHFLEKLKKLEPHQYYYPQNELHLTILSIISCITGFKLSSIDINAYVSIFEQTLSNIGGFKIKYQGLTVSSSCILIQGFPESKQLTQLRDLLRINFKKAKLHTTIDSRYKISTAHITAVRCLTPFNDCDKLMHVLNQYKDYNFGTLDINSLALVYNNWYQTLSITQHLSNTTLNENRQKKPAIVTL